jgi:hypothetical protein
MRVDRIIREEEKRKDGEREGNGKEHHLTEVRQPIIPSLSLSILQKKRE